MCDPYRFGRRGASWWLGACYTYFSPSVSYSASYKKALAGYINRRESAAVPWIRNHRHFSLPCVRLNEAPIKRIIGRDGNDIEDCQPFSWFFCVLPFDIYPFGMNVLFNKLIRFIDVERRAYAKPQPNCPSCQVETGRRIANGSWNIPRSGSKSRRYRTHTHWFIYPGNPPAAARKKRVVPDI